jgi:hypothetical protein
MRRYCSSGFDVVVNHALGDVQAQAQIDERNGPNAAITLMRAFRATQV